MNDGLNKQLLEAVKKKAMGYTTTENVDEYSLVDGELSIVKRKVTQKEVPPDIAAVKFLIDEKSDDYSDMTEEELISERDRLIKMFRSDKNRQKGEKDEANQK